MVVQICNPSIGEMETGGSQDWSQFGLHGEFQENLGYVVRFYLKKKVPKKDSLDFLLILNLPSFPSSSVNLPYLILNFKCTLDTIVQHK
jgi:hypothetical protein